MLNTRISFGKDTEISIEESIQILTVIAKQYGTQRVLDAINVAIACMRKVQNQEE